MARKTINARCNSSSTALSVGGTVYGREADKTELLAKKFADISSGDKHSPKFRANQTEIESNYTNLFADDGPHAARSAPLNTEFKQQELLDALANVERKSSPDEASHVAGAVQLHLEM
jgi:hypothetical protein